MDLPPPPLRRPGRSGLPVTRAVACFWILATLTGPGVAAPEVREPVRVESGLLQGVPGADGDTVAFLGVPYAAPPVGKLRWREPRPAPPWEGVRKADRFGAITPHPARPA